MADPAFPCIPHRGPVQLHAAVVGFLAACLAGCSAATTSTVTAQPTGTLAPSPSPAVVRPTSTVSPTPIPSSTEIQTEFTVRFAEADVWDRPENEGLPENLQTQLIFGEKVLVLERQGIWARIEAVDQPSHKDPLGYPGWVRAEDLAPGWPAAAEFAVIMVPRAPMNTPGGGGETPMLYLDTRLPVISASDSWVEVGLPDGTSGLVARRDIRLTADPSASVPTDGLFALAESLVGQTYLWGGTTTDGYDCSGLTYRLFHAYGITLPRDADDLALAGTPVNRADLKKGDFIFTSGFSGGAISHVGMYWGANTTLDASGPHGVAILPFTDFFYKMYWITARRMLP